MLQVADGLIDLVPLLIEQGQIEPGGRVHAVQALRQNQFLDRTRIIPSLTERLAEIAAERRALRFEEGGNSQIPQSFRGLTQSNATKAASEPCVSQGSVDRNGLTEGLDSGRNPVLRRQQEAPE